MKTISSMLRIAKCSWCCGQVTGQFFSVPDKPPGQAHSLTYRGQSGVILTGRYASRRRRSSSQLDLHEDKAGSYSQVDVQAGGGESSLQLDLQAYRPGEVLVRLHAQPGKQALSRALQEALGAVRLREVYGGEIEVWSTPEGASWRSYRLCRPTRAWISPSQTTCTTLSSNPMTPA